MPCPPPLTQNWHDPPTTSEATALASQPAAASAAGPGGLVDAPAETRYFRHPPPRPLAVRAAFATGAGALAARLHPDRRPA